LLIVNTCLGEIVSSRGRSAKPQAAVRRLIPNSDNPFYTREDIAERYNRSRALPPDVELQWGDLIAAHVGFLPQVSVDLGCGTGRFTRILASRFGGRVIGIEPSLPMLRAAAALLRRTPGVALIRGRAEAVPLAASSAELVLMSMSYHHVADKPAALDSIRRTLRPRGAFCVRTCSLEALDSYLYQRFFPEARAFDEKRFPTRGGLVEEVTRHRFSLLKMETVRQRITDDLRTYRDNTATRAHSDLQALTDEQFAAGMGRFDRWLSAQTADRAVIEEVDLFTFAAT
jgi:ubiquinone/menaquinone biosynthesis C-methylase UbiE